MVALFHLLSIIACLGYLSAFLLYCRLLNPKRQTLAINKARKALLIGIIFHLLFLLGVILEGVIENYPIIHYLKQPYILATISLLLAMLYAANERELNVPALGLMIAPLTLVLLLFAAIVFHQDRTGNATYEVRSLLFIHVLSYLIAHVFLIFGFVVSLGILAKEYCLKRKLRPVIINFLPSLATLDKLLRRLISYGVILLFSGLIAGFIYAEIFTKHFFVSDTKVVIAIISVMLYSFLFLAMWFRGFRGIRAAWLAIIATVVLFSSYGVEHIGATFHVF